MDQDQIDKAEASRRAAILAVLEGAGLVLEKSLFSSFILIAIPNTIDYNATDGKDTVTSDGGDEAAALSNLSEEAIKVVLKAVIEGAKDNVFTTSGLGAEWPKNVKPKYDA